MCRISAIFSFLLLSYSYSVCVKLSLFLFMFDQMRRRIYSDLSFLNYDWEQSPCLRGFLTRESDFIVRSIECRATAQYLDIDTTRNLELQNSSGTFSVPLFTLHSGSGKTIR